MRVTKDDGLFIVELGNGAWYTVSDNLDLIMSANLNKISPTGKLGKRIMGAVNDHLAENS